MDWGNWLDLVFIVAIVVFQGLAIRNLMKLQKINEEIQRLLQRR